VDSGWAYDAGTATQNVLGTPIGPAHLIIGPPGPGGVYNILRAEQTAPFPVGEIVIDLCG
jgi:hypothetical protein